MHRVGGAHVAALAALLALVGIAPGAAAAPGNESVESLVRGSFLLSDHARPPPDAAAGWEPVSLPDWWDRSRPGARGNAWYRFELPAVDPSGERWGILVPHLNMNAAAFVNGELVGSGGRFEEPVAHRWNHPLYFPFSPQLLRPEGNVLHLRLFGYGSHSGVGEVLVGPDRMLAGRHASERFWRVDLSRFLTTLTALVSFITAALWLGSRESVYGYFSLATLLWSINSLNYHVVSTPVPYSIWEWSVHVSLDGFAVCLVFFAHRFLDLRRPRVERAVLAYGVAVAAAAALAAWHGSPTRFDAVVNVSHAVAIGLGAYCPLLLFTRRGQLSRFEIWAYALTGLAAVSVSLPEFAIQLGLLPPGSPRPFLLAAPIVIFGLGTILGVRFLEAFGRARNLNVELERSIAEKRAELEANFERVRKLEEAHLIAEERARIMREVHDGLGGQLVSTLALVEGGDASPAEVAEALRASLADMRLVVDSLDPALHELPTLLGVFRSRVEPGLRRSGLRFQWKVTDLPPLPHFGPEDFLQILRIVQEAVTNVVKHAKARVITIATGLREEDGRPGIAVEIRDDGVGLVAERTGGHGLRNMRERAGRIGARRQVSGDSGGTALVLWLPLEAELTPPS